MSFVDRSAPVLPRNEFPVCRTHHYLNHAGVNALPSSAARAMADWAGRAAQRGSLAGDDDNTRAEIVRSAAARLMGVEVSEVAFVKNTTEGLAFVANGLQWNPGERVLVPDREFPSTFYPWISLADRGVIIDRVEPQGPGWSLPVDAFARAIDSGPPPRVVALSWVQFGRGWQADLERLAALVHDAGGLLCVDVIQGLGVLPARLHQWGVDFATADAHKWLLGPSGVGVLYVRRTVMDELRPLEPGWASVAHREEWDNLELVWDSTARRFEGGSANYAGICGLGAALELLEKAGVDRIWEHVDALCDHLSQGLAARGARVLSDRRGAGRSGIVTFEVPGHHPADVVGRLLARSVVVAARGGGVRVSPHGYSSLDDIDAVLAVIEELTGQHLA
jgi:cysteine desulfurase / selenocysteine lyase